MYMYMYTCRVSVWLATGIRKYLDTVGYVARDLAFEIVHVYVIHVANVIVSVACLSTFVNRMIFSSTA